MAMNECTHDLAERETACTDGMCPQCLAADNESLRDTVSYMRLMLLKEAKVRAIPSEAGKR